LASPKGGQPPFDPSSDTADAQADASKRFKADDAAQKVLAHTETLATVSADRFDANFFYGGHGPLWDLAQDADGTAMIEASRPATAPSARNATHR
jgi:putative intracellular protease/amidase